MVNRIFEVLENVECSPFKKGDKVFLQLDTGLGRNRFVKNKPECFDNQDGWFYNVWQVKEVE